MTNIQLTSLAKCDCILMQINTKTQNTVNELTFHDEKLTNEIYSRNVFLHSMRNNKK